MSGASEQTNNIATEVEVSALLSADSPRFGISSEHVESLVASDAELPPILVQRQTRRIIDGVHRVQAARARGQRTIQVRWFDGDDHTAFLQAVRTNTAHGLPLSTAERKRAASRILDSQPSLSDRALAALVGLSDKTVAAVRRDNKDRADTGPGWGHQVRVGQDGRMRPTDATAGRMAAAEVVRQNPTSSLRQIAALSGLSVGTARDVRRRIAEGEHPVPPTCLPDTDDRPATTDDWKPTPSSNADDAGRRTTTLETLFNDPSFRMSETGRTILKRLSSQVRSSEEWAVLAPTIPQHGRQATATILRSCADDLLQIAESLSLHGATGDNAPKDVPAPSISRPRDCPFTTSVCSPR